MTKASSIRRTGATGVADGPSGQDAGGVDTLDPTVHPPSSAPVGHQGIRVDVAERRAWSVNGIAALIVSLAVLGAAVWLVVRVITEAVAERGVNWVSLVLAVLFLLVALLVGAALVVIPPGHTRVVQFFGRYIGTSRSTGLTMITPLSTSRAVSVRVNNFETNALKVNDADGNPVEIAAIVVWQVADTARACFSVENYENFIRVQSEAALRHVATTHPYDDPDGQGTSLRGSTDLVSADLAHEVAERVVVAGLEIVEVRISHLAYAPEIAQAMLQRQQASAIVAARSRIVDGAVGMVEMALARLESNDVVALDDERKAAMVSNLLVVLCGEAKATPVVNTGSLYT
ncbi:MAG TPA: SPFH domain-containing protein [Dermatophilaceae bacterium]|nr:SPFH domain-containing protein [Dermatophilaceae bacterium]